MKKKINQEAYSLIALIVFGGLFLVELVGLVILKYKPFFQSILVFQLLIAAVIVLLSQPKSSSKYYLFIIIGFAVGFFAEMLGVQTGWLFGDFYFTEKLRFLVAGVPLIVGVNWVVFSLSSFSVLPEKMPAPLKHFIAAILMVILAFFLEIMAVSNELWVWKNSSHFPTYKNFVDCFLIALVMQLLIYFFQLQKNKIAAIFFYVFLLFLISFFLIEII